MRLQFLRPFRSTLAAPLCLATLGIVTLPAAPARADVLSACGNIELKADAKCEVKVGGGCEVACEPINFTAACYAKCEGGCELSIEAGCEVDCSGQCGATCEVDPGKFDCTAQCELDCNASCDGFCSAQSDQAQCKGSCEATCNGECGASCDATAPSATCDAKCTACCSGTCQAEANFDCQLECQGGCTAELEGGCTAKCQKPEGAVFCDGQFIDTSDLDSCLDALNAFLTVEVTASGSASCDGGSCKAEGEVGVSCAAAPGRLGGEHAPWYLLGAAALGLVGVMRRRS